MIGHRNSGGLRHFSVICIMKHTHIYMFYISKATYIQTSHIYVLTSSTVRKRLAIWKV